MSRKHWKQPYSFSLDSDVAKILREAERKSGISKSSIVQTAILFWHAQKWQEWGLEKPANGQPTPANKGE